MRYIRTKDGRIVDLERYRIVNNTGMPYIQFYDKEKKIYFELSRQDFENFKQADTIEELCDEFVLHYGDVKQTSVPIPWSTYERRDESWFRMKEKLIAELNKKERKAIVYGAIWTDKGLIYVAKMNEKGELELL